VYTHILTRISKLIGIHIVLQLSYLCDLHLHTHVKETCSRLAATTAASNAATFACRPLRASCKTMFVFVAVCAGSNVESEPSQAPSCVMVNFDLTKENYNKDIVA